MVTLTDGSKNTLYKCKKITKYKIKCDHCDKSYSTNTEMEIHIESDHLIEGFNRDKCDKLFVSKWRLRVHQKSHALEYKKRNCHYNNSDKRCPFEKLGCKFEHIMSRDCKFGVKCKHNMCQFRH